MKKLNTIVLKGIGIHDEGRADVAITPGMAIRLQADGGYSPETLAPGVAAVRGVRIAKEPVTPGSPYLTPAPRGTVDSVYAIGDLVFFYTPQSGDHLNVLVKSGETIAIGDPVTVEGSGSGKWIKGVSSTLPYQAQALEASGGALGADTLLIVEIL